MRALVTGGAGFIGSHLAERLLDTGHSVIILDDLSTGRVENLEHLAGRPGLECVFDTVTDDRVVAPLVSASDVVFHLAAAVGVKLVVEDPVHTIKTNVDGTDVVLRQAMRTGPLVIVASTSEVYGKSAAIPFREDGDLLLGSASRNRWGYAASKLVDEFLALGYWKQYRLPVVVVRLFNTVGPRQSARYGMVLPNFVERAMAGEPLVVHGDGQQTRSFTWVGDVVTALTRLSASPRAVGQIFNIGNDEEIAIGSLAERVRDLAASSSRITLVPYDQVFSSDFEDMRRRVPDISKLQRYIGFRPTVGIDEIVKRTIDEFRRQGYHRPHHAIAAHDYPGAHPVLVR